MARAVSASQLASVALTRGRLYTEEELWNNIDHFLKYIIPIAEEASVAGQYYRKSSISV